MPRSLSIRLALLAAVAALAGGAAQAADLGEYGPPPYARPYGPGFRDEGRFAPPPPLPDRRAYEAAPPCRVVLRPRFDAYGREIVHRIRICDEGVVGPAHGGWAPPPRRFEGGPGPQPRPRFEPDLGSW